MDLDGIIVLGAKVGVDGYPGRVARLRLVHALKLWQERLPEGCLLLCGGVRPGTPISEARAMADWSLDWAAREWGPEASTRLNSCLVLEETSLSTAASAANTLPLILALNLKAVGLVTDGLHMHRARFLFNRHYRPRGIALHPLPFPGLFRDYISRGRLLRLTKLTLREGGAWIKVLANLALKR